MNDIPFSTLKYLHEDLKQDLQNAFTRVLSDGWFINGNECKLFEKEYADYCGCKHTIGCGNGLDAITLALKAYKIGPGDEVLVPAFTFVATVLAVVQTGATPVLVDVELDTALIDVDKIKEKISSKTKAIIPVHLYGQPANIAEIQEISKQYGLYVIYDAAQAHGAKFNKKSIATYGDACCFSFYPGKNLGALGDGGAICTNDDAYMTMKMLTNYGANTKYNHEVIGVNSRLDELQAAFLRIKLKKIDMVNKERKKIAKVYLNEITNPGVVLPQVKYGDHVWHIFAIRCNKRNELQQKLKKSGIETGIHYPIPINKQICFSNYNFGTYPVAEEIAETELSLPLFYGMSEDIAGTIVDTINKIKV